MVHWANTPQWWKAHPLGWSWTHNSEHRIWENKKDIRVLLVQWFSKNRWFFPQRIFDNVCRYFGLSKLGGGNCYQYLVNRGPGCYQTSFCALNSLLITNNYPAPMSIMLRLKNPTVIQSSSFKHRKLRPRKI